MVNKMKKVSLIFVLLFMIALTGCSIHIDPLSGKKEETDDAILSDYASDTYITIINNVMISDEAYLKSFLDATMAKEKARAFIIYINTKAYNERRKEYSSEKNYPNEETKITYLIDFDGKEYKLLYENSEEEAKYLNSYDYLNYSFDAYDGTIYGLLTDDPNLTCEQYFRRVTTSSLFVDEGAMESFPIIVCHKKSELVFYGNKLNQQEYINYYDGNTTRYYCSLYTSRNYLTAALYSLHYQQDEIKAKENELMISYNMSQELLYDENKLIDKDDKFPHLDIHYDIYLESKFVKLSFSYNNQNYILYSSITDDQIKLIKCVISDEYEDVVTKGNYVGVQNNSRSILLQLLDDKAIIMLNDNILLDGSYIIDGKTLTIKNSESEYVFRLEGYVNKILIYDASSSKNVDGEVGEYLKDLNLVFGVPFSKSVFVNLDTSLGLDLFVITARDRENKCILLPHNVAYTHDLQDNPEIKNRLDDAISIEEMKEVLATYSEFDLNFINIYFSNFDAIDVTVPSSIVKVIIPKEIINELGLNISTNLKNVLLTPTYSSGMIYASLGDSLDIGFILNPADYEYKNVYYKSSNTNVVTIDANGKANFVGKGNAYIIVSVDGVLAYYPVYVGGEKTPIEKVIGDINKITIYNTKSIADYPNDYYTYTNERLIYAIKEELLNLEFVKADYQLFGMLVAYCRTDTDYAVKVYISDSEFGEVYVDWLKIDSFGDMQMIGRYVALRSGNQVVKYLQIDIDDLLEEQVVLRYLDCALTNEEQKMIVKSFIMHKGDLASAMKYDLELEGDLREYYGKYNDYYAVIVDGAGLGYDEALWTDTIDGVEIHYRNGNQIYLINDYNVFTLKEGFEAGIINHNDLEAINSIGDLK